MLILVKNSQCIQTTNLMFNLLHCVSEENGGVRIRCAHLGLRALQGWEEAGVEQCWLVKAKLRGNISRHTKIGILKIKITP